MSLKELIEMAQRRKKCGPDHGLYDMTILADFAARLLLSLDVEAVERRNVADVINISAAVLAAIGE